MSHNAEQKPSDVLAAAEAILERLPRKGGRIRYGFDLRKSHESEWGGPELFEALERAVNDARDDQVDRCPECDTKGNYDGRVLVGGRGVYTCPTCGAKWQNGNEEPTTKGVAVLP